MYSVGAEDPSRLRLCIILADSNGGMAVGMFTNMLSYTPSRQQNAG